jgi:ubiquinone/menaquinone biosynthesis C-methylase UbiE
LSAKRKNFNGVAAAYQALEFLAFGGDLARTRFAHVDHLVGSGEVLILGDGDGRFAHRLASLDPNIRLHCIDHSAAMIALARKRMAALDRPERVQFTQADATTFAFAPGRYDAVTTVFFLDCFTDEQVADLVARLAAALRPQARWLFADFQVAAKGYARLRSRAWLALLYGFFRWQTGITARRLPRSEEQIKKAGFARLEMAEFQSGLLRSAVYARAADRTGVTAAEAAAP